LKPLQEGRKWTYRQLSLGEERQRRNAQLDADIAGTEHSQLGDWWDEDDIATLPLCSDEFPAA
jgi:hypothetical protein